MYVPGRSDSKSEKRVGHGHMHSHSKAANNPIHKGIAKKDMVVATIDNQVVSWENNWFGPSADSSSTTLPTTFVTSDKTTFVGITNKVTESTTICPASETGGVSATKIDDKPNSGRNNHVPLLKNANICQLFQSQPTHLLLMT